jgi:hypothetical protein
MQRADLFTEQKLSEDELPSSGKPKTYTLMPPSNPTIADLDVIEWLITGSRTETLKICFSLKKPGIS